VRHVLLLLLLAPALLGWSDDPLGDTETDQVCECDLPLAAFDGEWLLVTVKEDEARLLAIDSALSELSWIVRAIVRPILRRATVPPERYLFQVDAAGIALGESRSELRRLSLDGAEHPYEDDGRSLSVSATTREGAIDTRWQTAQAHGSALFRTEDNGATLLVESALDITALSNVETIRYQARFSRAPTVSSVSLAQ
jgi:hypothetical protein